MSFFTVAECAELVNKSIPTIYRRIKDGKLSKNSDGFIDKAEILRCFGEIRIKDTQENKEIVIKENDNEDFLKKMIIDLKNDIDKLKVNSAKHEQQALEREQQALNREQQAFEREKKLMLLLENKSDQPPETITKKFKFW